MDLLRGIYLFLRDRLGWYGRGVVFILWMMALWFGLDHWVFEPLAIAEGWRFATYFGVFTGLVYLGDHFDSRWGD